jgi:hypothetical protein
MVVPLFSAMYVRFQPYRNGDLFGTLIGSKQKVLMVGHINMAQKWKLIFSLGQLPRYSW